MIEMIVGGEAMRGWRWNLCGSVVLLAVTAAISIGLPTVNGMVSGDRPVSPGAPIQLIEGVSVVPPPGATQDDGETGDGVLVLNVRGIRYAIEAKEYASTLQDADRGLRRRIARRSGHQLRGPSDRIRTQQGTHGLEGRFTSAGREGYFAVFVACGRSVEVVAQGDGLHLGDTLELIRDSVTTVRFERADD